MARKELTPITLPADPTNALEAATKQYVDGQALYVGTTAPTNPLTELWYDTDEPAVTIGPAGNLAYVIGTANVTGASPSAVTIITTASLTVGTSRRIQITYSSHGALSSTAPNFLAPWQLQRDGAVIASWQMDVARNNVWVLVNYTWIDTPPGPTATYRIQFASNVGVVGADMADATYKRILVVSDVGAV